MDALQEALENAFTQYANNTAIEVENHSVTYAELKNQSQRLFEFLKAEKIGGGGQIALLSLAIVS